MTTRILSITLTPMKQKGKTSNNLVTKDYFKKELKRELKKYPTKAYLKRELNRYSTKKDLREEIDSLEMRVRRMIDELKLDITEANRQYRDEFRLETAHAT